LGLTDSLGDAGQGGRRVGRAGDVGSDVISLELT
jgi:hypothetical protein